MAKRGPKIRYHDVFHRMQRQLVRRYRARQQGKTYDETEIEQLKRQKAKVYSGLEIYKVIQGDHGPRLQVEFIDKSFIAI